MVGCTPEVAFRKYSAMLSLNKLQFFLAVDIIAVSSVKGRYFLHISAEFVLIPGSTRSLGHWSRVVCSLCSLVPLWICGSFEEPLGGITASKSSQDHHPHIRMPSAGIKTIVMKRLGCSSVVFVQAQGLVPSPALSGENHSGAHRCPSIQKAQE